MRLAVFTNQFPGPVCTFFARDMRGIIEAGIEIDVFPIYPLDPTLWRYVPDILNEKVLPRNRVHHLTIGESLRKAKISSPKKLGRFLTDAVSVSASAIRYGMEPLAKSSYACLKAWVWARRNVDVYDHVLAYWGNYAATSAYLFHRLANSWSPFSLFLHAGLDLYRTPLFMRQKLLYADNIITCSDFNDQFIREHYSDIAGLLTKKIYVHHHGLDLAEFSFHENGRVPRKVIAVGRMEKAKGFDYLIRAAHQLKQSGVDINVELVGDGREAQYLKALSSELNVNDRVTFRGWLTADETREAMKEASILVHPSPDLGDGVPNVIKECMALGTPVIASSIAGIPELLDGGNNGVLVPARDIDALSRAIRRLLANNDQRLTLAASARKYVEEKFDLWPNGKRLAQLLCSTNIHRPTFNVDVSTEPILRQ